MAARLRNRRGKIEVELRHGIAHRACHIEVGAGERAGLVNANAALNADCAPLHNDDLVRHVALGIASAASMKRSIGFQRSAMFIRWFQ